MELDYASPPPAAPPARRQSADMLGSTSRSSQAVGSTSSIAKTGEPLTTVDTSNDAVAFKESNAACRILDELLGDMLSIVEEQDSSSDEDGDERNINSESESWSTSSSTSDAEDNSDTLKLPISKAGSPRADSEMEEGELESEHEVESKRIQVEAKLKEAEERKGRREEKKKQSIERNVSERDVYRYLKHRGEFRATALPVLVQWRQERIEIVSDAPSHHEGRMRGHDAPQANVYIDADIYALLAPSYALKPSFGRAYLECHDIVSYPTSGPLRHPPIRNSTTPIPTIRCSSWMVF